MRVFSGRFSSMLLVTAAYALLTSCGREPDQTDYTSALAPALPTTVPDAVPASDMYINRARRAQQDELGFRPRKDLEPWSLKMPIDWGANPFDDDNWMFQLNAWRMIDPLLGEYFATGDPSHLEDALSFVRDWHRHNILEGRPNAFRWKDMATGIRAMHIAFLENARQRGVLQLDDVDSQMLRNMAAMHVAHTVQDGVSPNNHGLFQLAGMALICRVYAGDPACNAADVFIRKELDTLLSEQFTEQGVHKEHSPDYHLFMIRALDRVGALHPYMGEIDMETIEAVSPWLAFPDGTLGRFGDSEKTGLPLANDPKPTCLPDGQCFAVGDFSRSGYAIVRDLPSTEPDSMLFMSGMAYSSIHRHADALSFELFENGRFIFVDGGKYGYVNTPERRYFVTSDAHNIVSLAAEPFSPDRYAGSGSFLDSVTTDKQGFLLSGKVEIMDQYVHERRLTYQPGVSLEIHDKIQSVGANGPYASQLLLAPDLVPELQGDGFVVTADGLSLRATLRTPNCTLDMARGQESPLRGWHSPSYLQMVPATSVRAVCSGPEPTIVWFVEFNPISSLDTQSRSGGRPDSD